jgi:hypothetical protein
MVYTFNCNVKDQYDATPNTFSITLTVNPKEQTKFISPFPNMDRSLRLPEDVNISFAG